MTQATTEKKQVKFGDYLVTGKIGQGGIAEIYRAKQASLDRDVAIKILSAKLSNDPDIVRRFERESMVIARLSHPNIVHVIDKGKAGSRYYFVMEFVDGTSLREVIDSKRIELRTKLEMVAQVCKALDYAHKNGVIHRDIKPTNILIDRQGNARVADFGIAQIVGSPDSELTASDVIMGTLAYMSPEQKISSTNVDHTTDIYAVGIIIYEILTGKKPLGRFQMPSEVNPELSGAFDAVISRCLASEPKDRYQSAVELKNDLLDVIQGGHTFRESDDISMDGASSFVGKCRYLDTLQETRFGSTVLVENKINKRLYVIKKHFKGEAGRKEASILASMKHPNIIGILGSGGDNKTTVIITEYAQGGSLSERMVRRYDWRKAMRIVLPVAEGMDFAHKNNIVHGNLRPSNILFDADEMVKICDFGLPSHYDTGSSNKRNWYAPPEHKKSKQGDVYAVGVILHQLILDRNPQHDAAGQVWLDDVAGQLPQDVRSMLTRLLAVRVSQRYKSFEELLLDWETYEEACREAEERRKARAEEALPEPAQKFPPWAIPAAVAGIIIVVVLVLLVSGVFG